MPEPGNALTVAFTPEHTELLLNDTLTVGNAFRLTVPVTGVLEQPVAILVITTV